MWFDLFRACRRSFGACFGLGIVETMCFPWGKLGQSVSHVGLEIFVKIGHNRYLHLEDECRKEMESNYYVINMSV